MMWNPRSGIFSKKEYIVFVTFSYRVNTFSVLIVLKGISTNVKAKSSGEGVVYLYYK